jgi:hypothetical protein
MKKYFMIATLALIVSVGLTLLSACQTTKDTNYESYVAVDINPSYELMVNSEGKVTGFYKTNEDALVAMNEKTVVGMSIDLAVVTLIDEAEQQGYFKGDDKHVLITTLAEDESIKHRVEAKIEKKIQSYENEHQVAIELSKDHQEPNAFEINRSVQLQVSIGKLRLIEALMAFEIELTYEEAKAMSINEIMSRLNTHQTQLSDGLPKNYQNMYQAVIARRYMTFRLAKVNLIAALAQSKLLLEPTFYDDYLKETSLTKTALVDLYKDYQNDLRQIDTTSSITAETEINQMILLDTVIIEKTDALNAIDLEIKALFDSYHQEKKAQVITELKAKLVLRTEILDQLNERVYELIETNYEAYLDYYIYVNFEVKLLTSKEMAFEYKAIFETHNEIFKSYGLSIEGFEALFELNLEAQLNTIRNQFLAQMQQTKETIFELKNSVSVRINIEVEMRKQQGSK